MEKRIPLYESTRTFFTVLAVFAFAIGLSYVSDWCHKHDRPHWLCSGMDSLSVIVFIADALIIVLAVFEFIILETARIFRLVALCDGGESGGNSSLLGDRRVESRIMLIFATILLVVMLITSWLHLAWLALARIQSWSGALEYTFPILILPFWLQWLLEISGTTLRRIILASLVIVGTVAASGFIWSLACDISFTSDPSSMLSPSNGLKDSIRLISRMTLDVIISFAIIFWIRRASWSLPSVALPPKQVGAGK